MRLTKTTNTAVSFLKTIAVASVLMFPLQSFAEQARDYGDTNDEYVAWESKDTEIVKTSLELKSDKKQAASKLAMKTKKMSADDLNKNSAANKDDAAN